MTKVPIMQDSKYRIALWTPLPPLKTGIADYVAELLPYLVNYFDVEIFVHDSYAVSNDLFQKYIVYSYSQYGERAQNYPFDLNIYQLGNNEYHSYIYEQALKVPGLVILHDFSLSLMLYHHYAGTRNDLELFKREFLFSEGEKELTQFNRIYDHGDNDALMEFFSNHQMLTRLVGRNYAVVSHLEYCAKLVQAKYGASRVYSMYLGSPDPMLELAGLSKHEARMQLGIPDDKFIVGVFGFLQPNKQNDVMVRALARIKAKHEGILLMFVGEINPALNYDRQIKDLISKFNLEQNVHLTGFVARKEMQKYYIACDAIVNLRFPSFGQMSATLSRGIATGRPVIITDLPEWKIFADSYCWRVPPDDKEGRAIAELICRLIEDPVELERRGASAREFFLESGTSEKAAANLKDIVDDVILNAPGEVKLAEEQFAAISRTDVIKATFDNWVELRSGGPARYKYEKLRKIPLIGPFLVYTIILVSNLINTRNIRRAEWALLKALIDETFRFDSDIKKLTYLFEPEPVRRLDNPLVGIVGYQPRQRKKNEQEDSDESFYLSLEKAFRGSEEVIRKRQRNAFAEIMSYAHLDANARILDAGCGRGEFLSLLKSAGLHSIGVDTNRTMIRTLQKKGFEVYAQDLFEYLASTPDGFFNGITSFHVIEHLSHEQNMKFLSLAYQKLARGGIIYLETPNPLCLESLSKFYTDPTHIKPIQPFQLSFLLEYNSYKNVRLLFFEPIRTRGTLSEEKWITLYQDYGVLAMK